MPELSSLSLSLIRFDHQVKHESLSTTESKQELFNKYIKTTISPLVSCSLPLDSEKDAILGDSQAHLQFPIGHLLVKQLSHLKQTWIRLGEAFSNSGSGATLKVLW